MASAGPVRQFNHWKPCRSTNRFLCWTHAGLRIKNTFIDISERAAGRSRSTSLPPRNKVDQTEDDGDSCSCAEEENHNTTPEKLPNQVMGIEAISYNAIDVSAHHGDTASEEKLVQRYSEVEARLPARTTKSIVGGKSPTLKEQDYTMSRNSTASCKRQTGQARWWNDVDDACPVTGFPIKLLPCPPFKLNVQGESARLVDGSTLLLTVLAKWDFKVLGMHLTSNQIRELDDHVKRCKRGPYRLAKAIELLTQGTRESQQEFELIRAKAQKKLRDLRHIQRARIRRA